MIEKQLGIYVKRQNIASLSDYVTLRRRLVKIIVMKEMKIQKTTKKERLGFSLLVEEKAKNFVISCFEGLKAGDIYVFPEI